PHLGRKIVAVLAKGFNRRWEENGLTNRGDLRLQSLLEGLIPESGEVRWQHHAGDNVAFRLLESRYLRGEVVQEVLITAGIGKLVAELVEHRRESELLVAPGVAIAVVGEQSADGFVRLQLPPHIGEDGDDVLKSPEIVIGVVEGLPRGRT